MNPTRRELLALAAAAAAVASPAQDFSGIPVRDGIPRVDSHPEAGMTVARALALSEERGVKFGLVQHAGVNDGAASAELIDNDERLIAWVRSLAGKPVFAGIQAERMNWMSAFSKDAIAKLDYVLGDALTMPDDSGALVKLWTPAFHTDNAERFMDRYVEYHVEVISTMQLDILANPTFLPEPLQPAYATLWTNARMRKIIDAAVKHRIAIEINSRYRVPRLPFLLLAKDAGLKFSFGSNAHTADAIGNIDYGVEMFRSLALPPDRFFRPARIRHVG